MRFLIVSALCVMLPGCGLPGFDHDDGMDFCPGVSRPSVVVTVVDPAGNLVEDARVTFTVNGGPEQQTDCVEWSHPSSGCRGWAAGWETPGEFTVTVASADGQHTLKRQILVSDGECSVKTETVTITLPSAQ
jgi:hypothetical protein